MDGKKKLKNKKPSLSLLASTIFSKSSTHFFFFRNTHRFSGIVLPMKMKTTDGEKM